MDAGPIRIEFERTGGLAGITLRTSVHTLELPGDQAHQIEEMVERVDLSALSSSGEGAGGADRFRYRLVITRGAERVEAVLPETALTEELRQIVDWMTERAKKG